MDSTRERFIDNTEENNQIRKLHFTLPTVSSNLPLDSECSEPYGTTPSGNLSVPEEVNSLLIHICNSHVLSDLHMLTPLESQYDVRMSGKLLLMYICNFHVLSHLLLIYICKLHWKLSVLDTLDRLEEALELELRTAAKEKALLLPPQASARLSTGITQPKV